MTVTNPIGGTRVVTSNISTGLVTSDKNENGKTTTFGYDTLGRLTKVTNPEGDFVEYTYDGRGNATRTRLVSKTPGTPADINTYATYPTTCGNPLTCNKPTELKDALGNVTDITYDGTHGGVLTVTAPAAATGGTRPQTRYTYEPKQAYYKNSAGSIVASGVNHYMLTNVSSCSVGASCAGTANESKLVMAYGPQTTGTANNLFPVSVTRRSGNTFLIATETMTYDDLGNRLTVDGPLSGTADTVRTRYDALNRVVGIIGPDPDGTGTRKHMAQKFTYNANGQVTAAEIGTVNSQSDSDWAAFAMIEKVVSIYDANDRKSADQLHGGGAVQAVTQYTYNALGRPECTIIRMNPSQFGSLPVNPTCAHRTPGSFGPDRITKTTYDAAGQVTKVQTAYGVTGVAADEVTNTYTNNGKLATLVDGEGHTTTYSYDGHDRLSKIRYPLPSGSGSSTTDYHQFLYDQNGNVTEFRTRSYGLNSAMKILLTYDNLNRLTFKNLWSTEPDTAYEYDLLGRMTKVSRAADGTQHLLSYDALGRLLQETQPFGSASYQYDLAGRRTRLTWNDGFYVTYDNDVTGNVTAIRENGASSGVGVLATYAYDNLGRRTGITRGNGTSATYGYDPVSRLSSLVQNLSGPGLPAMTGPVA